MENEYGVIYKLTNIINNKVYIGQTIDLDRRLKEHFKSKDSYPIHSAIRKYGKENFKCEVIDIGFNKDDLDEKETYWVKTYNSTESGYNIRAGGSKDMVGINNPFYGKTFEPETKERILSKLKEWQVTHPEEYSLAQSRCGSKNGSFGKKFTAERKKNIGRPGESRFTKGYKLICLETGEIFPSILSASKKYGHRKIIKHCCDDPKMSLYGLHFKYIN